MNKRSLIQTILDELAKKLAIATQAALAAHDEATHEDAKAENKYDTRGLEASYLAGAQSERAAQLQSAVAYFENLALKSLESKDRIAAAALVELASEGRTAWYFLSPQEGGLEVVCEGEKVFVLGTQSPLGTALMGKSEGDAVDVKTPAGLREYEICLVR